MVSMEACTDKHDRQQCNTIHITMHLQSEGTVWSPCRVGRSWDADRDARQAKNLHPYNIAKETTSMYHSWQRKLATTIEGRRQSKPIFFLFQSCNSFLYKPINTHRHYVSTVAINIPCLLCIFFDVKQLCFKTILPFRTLLQHILWCHRGRHWQNKEKR